MVQEESFRLNGLSLEQLSEWVCIDVTSESGLRWRKTASSTATKGSRAGSFSKTVKFPCWRIKVLKTALVVSRVIWFLHYRELPDIIDHKNGNPYDNSLSNLRSVPIRVNTQNRQVSNPTGFMGVYRHHDKYGNPSYRCQGVTESGEPWRKSFSCRKYGEEGARMKAIRYREDMESLHKVMTRGVSLNDVG